MRVTLRLTDGTEKPCRVLPTEYYVVAPGHCPICTSKSVLISHDIRETAIFHESKRDAAVAHLRGRGAQTMEDVAHQPEFRVRGENPQEREYSTVSDAGCQRCRYRVGMLIVPLDTLFGRTEDNMILSGQCGIVIAAKGRHA